MIPLDEAGAKHEVGAKARTLARARAAGLPVLDGVVVLPGEEVDANELAAALGRLGGRRFVVRSSAMVEDLPGASAAGVFESVVDVPAEGVAEAIERVRAAAGRQAALAYLGARGLLAGRPAMAVLVQPLAAASRLGVVRGVAEDDGALLAEERPPGEPEHGAVEPRRVLPGEPLAALVRQAAALVGGTVDVEYAVGADGAPPLLLLQARPLTAPPPPRHPERFRHDEPGTWVLDAEHNPAPLSEAQASLVARASRIEGLPAQRVIQGYLYVRSDPAVAAVPEGSEALGPARWFAERIVPRAEALLAPLESTGEPPLAEVLEVFDEVARLHGAELRPVLRQARAGLDQLLQRSMGEPLVAHGDLLSGCGGRTRARDQLLWELGRCEPGSARGAELLDRLGAEHGASAPAWDVAVPTDDEEPARVLMAARLTARGGSPEARHAQALLEAKAAAQRLGERLAEPDRQRLGPLLEAARQAMTVAEDDDALFFRAQRLVRRALLAIGRRAAAGQLDGPWQVFDLPIEEVAAGALDAGRARGLRALREARGRQNPPSVISEGRPAWTGGGRGAVLAGAGTSGRGYGPALVVRADRWPSEDEARGAVLVMAAVLPSLTFLLPAAAGLVTDVGGALSHAATLAREYGVPAVLGTGSATRLLADGDDVIVDADHGRVYPLGRPGRLGSR